MKRSWKWLLPISVIIGSLVIGGSVYASYFVLNTNINASVNIKPIAPPPTTAKLYMDVECTKTLTSIDFGNISPQEGIVTRAYVKSSEVSPSSINVTSDIDTTKATIGFTVGVPTAASIPIDIILTPKLPTTGIINFTINVTGHS